MTFDRAKIIAEGGKYHGPDDMLVECAHFVAESVTYVPVAETGSAPASIKEDANLPKRMVIEGVFQRFMPANIAAASEMVNKYRNANKRVYPMERLERKVLTPDSAVQRRIAERAMIGHLEHPADGTTDLNKGAILVTKVWAESDGTIRGRAMVYNTPEGLRLQEYIVTGTKVGISSRGTGTVDANGFVCEDFELETWDMVYNPSTFGANPTLSVGTNESISREPAVQTQPVLETAAPAGKTPPQDKPMTVAERLAQVREQASRLLAVDPKLLTVEQRKVHAADLLNLRIAVAEEFSGEKRMVVEALLKQIDGARAVVETASDTVGGFNSGAAPEGQGDGAGIPGNTWDMLNKAVAASGSARTVALEGIKGIADLIAANLGKLPAIRVATEAVIADKPADAPNALPEVARAAIAEARDQLIQMTERDEAASAIIRELTERLAKADAKVDSLVSENADLKAAAEKSAKVIADMTSAKNAASVAESAVPPKGADEPAKRKPLHERLAKPQAPASDAAALPPKGTVVESAKDAAQGASKTALREGTSRGASLAATALTKLNVGA